MSEETAEAFIAVRSREQVAADAAELARRCAGAGAGAGAGPGEEAGEEAGALAVYRWALDPAGPAPVTGRVLGAPLAELDLAVEERAAIEAARDRTRPGPERARAAGAARTLGWILGFTPVGP